MAHQQHNEYVPGYARQHIQHHEWRTAENSAPHLIPHLQRLAASKPKLSLLDVGSGSGTITTSLAKYIPQGTLTGVDLSEEIVSRANAEAQEAGIANVTFQAGSIYSLPFQDNSFDVVHAHQVLTHLDQPVEALKELLRVCRPNGGLVASREADMRMWSFHPSPPGLVAFHKLIGDVMVHSGGHRDAGAKLVSWALAAGAQRDRIHASCGTWCYSSPEERQVWGGSMMERIQNGGMRRKALQEGMVTEEQLRDMVRGWEEWLDAEDGFLGCMHGEIVIEKA
ncbi:methylase [Polychaeton citri CBS 116435]|uniref:Methylase n=1 Tax=Polychaeton citri CBS 116435 TaxID=1314669 RepID=A0A9P4Q615_9PEZI|nr:methylase [Polychaeton citri CBS 116435]